jgi:hypothetical protein
MSKYICKYRDGKRKRQLTLTASSRGMAMIGLLYHGVEMGSVIDLKQIKKKKAPNVV